jgi:hypothetical protein
MTEDPLPPRSPRPHPRFLAAATLLAAFAFAGSAGLAAAQPGPAASGSASAPRPVAVPAEHGGPRWGELTASQRRVLAPLAADWNDGIDSRGKERWLDVAARFPRMPADEQQRATQRMVEWAHMTVAQRTQARANYQAMSDVSRAEREARWKAYQALPDEKKRELAKRAAAAAPPGSAPAVAAVRRHAPPPLGTVQPKTNVVGSRSPAAAGSAPAAAPAWHPGATTTLLNRRAAPPVHQRDGQPKIAAGPNAVDRTTLLPKRPQAASAGAAASTGAAAHP